MTWLLNLAIAIDQLFNVLLFGSPDETLSSRAYRTDRDGRVFGKVFRPCIDTLIFWQPRHCYEAYLSEIRRRQYSANFR